jgi:RNA polymerase sigma factor (sigma-70 family)
MEDSENQVRLKLWGELLGQAKRVARKKTDNSDEAEELAMDSLKNLFEAIKRGTIALKFNTQEYCFEIVCKKGTEQEYTTSIESYLFTIISNVYIDRVRTRNLSCISIEASAELHESGLSVLDQEYKLNSPPVDEVLNLYLESPRHKEMILALRKMIYELRPAERKITLAYIKLLEQKIDNNENLSFLNKQVAELTGVTAGNVSSVLNRIRAKLRDWLHSEAQANPDLPHIWQNLLNDISSSKESTGRRGTCKSLRSEAQPPQKKIKSLPISGVSGREEV